MNQHSFVESCLAYYNENGLTPEPGGKWQKAHYPDPKEIGNSTIWLMFDHHQEQGLYQSEEYGCACFFNSDTLKFLERNPTRLDLWELYEKWSAHNQSKIPREILVANGRANGTATGATNISKLPRETLVANQAKIPKEILTANAKAINSQKWRCLETGFVTNPGNLTQYQRARGINISSRERLQ